MEIDILLLIAIGIKIAEISESVKDVLFYAKHPKQFLVDIPFGNYYPDENGVIQQIKKINCILILNRKVTKKMRNLERVNIIKFSGIENTLKFRILMLNLKWKAND